MDSQNDQAYEKIAEHMERIYAEMAELPAINITPSMKCAECGGYTIRALIVDAPAPYTGMKLIKPLCYNCIRVHREEHGKAATGEHEVDEGTKLYPVRDEG